MWSLRKFVYYQKTDISQIGFFYYMTSLNRGVRQLKIASDPIDISGRLGKKKDVFYKFKLGRSSDVYVTLSDFSQGVDLDIQLLNKKNRVLSQSTNSGGQSESIATTLKQGEYFVRVLNKRNKGKPSFRLRAATTDQSPSFDFHELTVQRGQSTQLTSNNLKVSSKLQATDQLRYTITKIPRNGVLKLNGVALGSGGNFTQADLEQGRITYQSNNPGITVLGNGSKPLVSGFNIVWAGPGGGDGGADNEIFFFDGSNTQQLTQNSVDDKVEGIDGSHVVWSSQIGGIDQRGTATYELFDFDGKTTNRLTNNALNEDFISVDGANLFWTSPVGPVDQYGIPTYEVFYAQSGTIRQLTSNAVNESVEDVDGATAVWEASLGAIGSAGRPTSEIFYFNGSEIKQITQNNVDDLTPRLDNGKIAWAAKVGGLELGAPTSEILLFDGTAIRQLTNNATDDFMGEIKGNNVVWLSRIGPVNGLGLKTYEIVRFDGTTTQRLTTNVWDDSIVEMDGANLLSVGAAGQPDAYGQRSLELFFFDGAKTTQLTTNKVDDIPAGLNGSKLVWYAQTGANRQGAATRELFYFDGTSIKQLTNDTKDDDFPSFSDTTLAWRSTDGVTSQILKYDLGDSFSFTISDRRNQASAEQVFQINFA